MEHGRKARLLPGRWLLLGAALTLAGLTAACESDIDREMRLEREALKKSGDLEKLEGQLNTINPDLYAPGKSATGNLGRHKSY
jgi:hypothetical protein